MPSEGQLVCSRCGYANVPGDVFCGSCGAFLEWEGTPGAGGPMPGAPGGAVSGPIRDPDVPVVGGPAAAYEAPAAGGAGPAPAVTPLAPVTPVTAAPAGQAAPTAQAAEPGLIRCPACGIANAPTRTFCQSCGSRLADTARVTGPSAAEIAAAVAAPNRPPVTPVSSGRTGPRPVPSQGGSRGLLGWIVVFGVLGVLAGVGIVVGGNLLKGAAPASEAGTAPAGPGDAASAAAASPAGGRPSGEAPASGEATAQAAPSAVVLDLAGATASSVVGNLEKFGPSKAIDGDSKTSWQEGASTEKGQWIEVSFAPSTVTSVAVRNGYGASTALYKGNRRLKDILVSIDGGKPRALRLRDTGKLQTIDLAGPAGSTSVRITIVSTYAGTKTSVPGTPFDDAAVSEIVVRGVPGS